MNWARLDLVTVGGWVLPRPHSLILQVRRRPWPHMRRKTPWGSKGSDVNWRQLPISLCGGIHLGWEMRVCTREDPETRQIWTLNRANQNDRSEENHKKCPVIITQTTMRARLRDTLKSPPRVSVHMYFALFPSNKYFACFTTFHLCGNSFPAKLNGQGLVTDHRSNG